MLKPLIVWMTTNWKILQEMGIPEHLTSLLRNLYAGQEATGHGTMDWFKTGKGVHQDYILSPCLFNLYIQSMSCEMPGWMKHKLESRLLGEIPIISDDTIIMAEGEEELKSLLIKVREESEKAGLKLNI